MLEEALLLLREDDDAVETGKRLRVETVDRRADALPEPEARVIGHVEGGDGGQAELVAQFRESEIDQCRETQRDMDQVDVLAA